MPWFQALADRPEIQLKVYFGMIPDKEQQGKGFGIPFEWDIPLLDGYQWEVLSEKGNRKNKAISVKRIVVALKESNPDAALLAGWNSPFLIKSLLVCRTLKIPLIVRGESNAMKPRPWWVRLIHRAIMAQFNAFLAIGKGNEEFYNQYVKDAGKLFHAPYCVDNNRFSKQASAMVVKKSILRRKWGIPDDKICFLFAGKLIQKKRPLDLLEALKTIVQKEPKIHLLVVGTGELMEQAQYSVRKYSLPVTFTGFLNQMEMAQAYVAADCLVLPSDYDETWGLVVNEAMACGIPAIVSDRVGCGPDLVDDGFTGYVFPFGDILKLAEVIMSVALDQTKLEELALNALDRVQEYTIEETVKGTVAAVQYVTIGQW